MNASWRNYVILLTFIGLTACSGGGGGGGGGNDGDDTGGDTGGNTGDDGNPQDDDTDDPPIQQEPCDDVLIVNLSRDLRSDNSCAMAGTREAVADCVETSIRNTLPSSCTSSFDVYVPGTAQEHGAWKQFNAMFSEDTGRGYLSLQYQDDISVEGTNGDALLYDPGVIDAFESLDSLLYTLKTRFQTNDVRVFGHSKGSHAVALKADDHEFQNMEFYAFAQPGRTAIDISSRSDIRAARLGTVGNIHKLSNNLIGITWKNDEVQYYHGGTTGLLLPEKWGFPGFIWQDTIGGTLAPFRIDHHNNYGGRYIDGLSNNDWRLGQGSRSDNYPYCATGNKQAMKDVSECVKQDVSFTPYFWGEQACRDKAFSMMSNGAVGEKHYIGNSGPRGANCTEAGGTISVAYRLEYNMNLADTKDCRYTMELTFQDLNGRNAGGSIKVTATDDTGWVTKSGTVKVPAHMRIRWKASMDELPGFGDCGHLTAASEGYIRSLRFTFTHPGTGRRITRTVIGNKEGSDYPLINLDMKNNVAWWNWNDPDDRRDTWDLFYAPRPSGGGGGVLMVKGDTDENRRGYFFKWVYLLD